MLAAPAICNRAFGFDPNAWIEVLRVGEYPYDEDLIQVVDTEALDACVAAFEQDRKRSNFPGSLVDFDHFSFDSEKSSEAAGWIRELQHKGDSLLARVDWSDAGEAAVRSGRFRLLSPVFNQAEMQHLGGKRYRPTRLESVGLTNQPRMRGLTPLANRESAASQPPSDVANLTATQAGATFSAEVARVKHANGWSHDQAWNHVRQTHGALFNRMADSPAPVQVAPAHDAEQAAVQFHAKVARVQRACGWTFNRALQDVQRQNPELLNRMGGLRITNREAKHAADRLLKLAQNRARVQSCSFDQAWREECAALPDLHTRASGKLFNREEAESSADFKRAQARAGKALEWVREFLEKQAHPDRGERIKSPDALRAAFVQTLKTYMTDAQDVIAEKDDKAARKDQPPLTDKDREWIGSWALGLTLEQAFDYIRETEPLFWTRFVLDTTDED